MLLFQPVEHLEIRHFPLFNSLIPCSFPSPARGYVEKHIDLNDLLVQHPNAAYFVKSSGDFMMGAGISAGDSLAVDNAREVAHRNIVIIAIGGKLTVGHLQLHPVVTLKPENGAYAPITIGSEDMLDTFGAAVFIIKSVGWLCLR